MRAEWLGSAGLTAMVRCLCGARLFLFGAHWRRRGFATCDECKAVIRYGSLEVVAAHEAEDFLAMAITRDEERRALTEELERELRRFVQVYSTQSERLWSPATRSFVRAVRPMLELLGGPINPPGGGDYGAAHEGACRGEDERPDRWSLHYGGEADAP